MILARAVAEVNRPEVGGRGVLLRVCLDAIGGIRVRVPSTASLAHAQATDPACHLTAPRN